MFTNTMLTLESRFPPVQHGGGGTALTARERRAAVLKHAAESHAALSTPRRAPPAGTAFTVLREFTNDSHQGAGQRHSLADPRKPLAAALYLNLSGFGLRTDATACTIQVLRREVWDMETASAELSASTARELKAASEKAAQELHACSGKAAQEARALHEQIGTLSRRCCASEVEATSLQRRLSQEEVRHLQERSLLAPAP